jgi:hypothetical protein
MRGLPCSITARTYTFVPLSKSAVKKSSARIPCARDHRRRADPGIDDPSRRAAARDIGYHLARMRKQRGMTQAEVAPGDGRQPGPRLPDGTRRH